MTAITRKTIAIVNGTGRQAASLIRVASALGYAVRAQVHSRQGLVAEELAELPNVTLFEGSLAENGNLVKVLFVGAQLAFINTTYLEGDEVAIGRALANAAKNAGTIQHYVYSSMPDHSIHNPKWPALPLWSCKFAVENYIRQLGLPATFVYAGCYNNNFTSLPYPLFCMELQTDGSFEWRAPFHPDIELPWLDAEHDVGPAVIQIFKDGPKRWNGHRIALAFELLNPRQVCKSFSRALQRPCRYVHDLKIDIRVPIPSGYKEQLQGLEVLFGHYHAPYFPGPEFFYSSSSSTTQHRSPSTDPQQAPTFDLPIRDQNNLFKTRTSSSRGSSSSTATAREIPIFPSSKSKSQIPASPVIVAAKARDAVFPPSPTLLAQGSERGSNLVEEARSLWEGWRSMEEYAREVFPIEEENNGRMWMMESLVGKKSS